MAPHEAIHILDGVDVDVVARFVQGVRPPFILHVMRARVKGEYGGRRCKLEKRKTMDFSSARSRPAIFPM